MGETAGRKGLSKTMQNTPKLWELCFRDVHDPANTGEWAENTMSARYLQARV